MGAHTLARDAASGVGGVERLRQDPVFLILDEGAEVAAPQGMTQLPERLGLDLANALARHLEPLAHLFERVLTLFADAESQSKDLLLRRRQHRERTLDLRGEILVQQRLVGRAR